MIRGETGSEHSPVSFMRTCVPFHMHALSVIPSHSKVCVSQGPSHTTLPCLTSPPGSWLLPGIPYTLSLGFPGPSA